jgi:hypothetical protein
MNSQENWQNPNYEGAIEVTTNILKKGCVVGCKICPQSILIERYQPEKNIIYLSFENFKTILGKIPKTYRIDFCGYAEPFLNKDCMRMIKYASDEGYNVAVYTTLVGVRLEDVEILARIPFKNWHPLCLHLPDHRGVANIKITKKYREILEKLIDLKPSFLEYMAMGEIHPDVHDLVEKIEGYVKQQGFTPNTRASNAEEVNKAPRVSGSIMCGSYPRLNSGLVVIPNGDVQVCGMDFGLVNTFGNLIEGDFVSLFEGEGYKELRHLMAHDKGPEYDDRIICRHCEFACAATPTEEDREVVL